MMIVLVAASVLAQLGPAAALKPFDTKPGLWETTTTSTTQGLALPAMPRIPKEQLDRMSAEQRARAEAEMKSRNSPGYPQTFVGTHCETMESRAAGNTFFSKLDAMTKKIGCKTEVISATSSKIQTHVECTISDVGLHSVSDVTEERIDSEHVNSVTASKTEIRAHPSIGSAQKWTQTISSTSKWVSSDCGDVKPFVAK